MDLKNTKNLPKKKKKKNRNNGKEPLVSWLTVLFSQCHTHDKWNFGNVDEEEVMMTLLIREIECVKF